MPKLLLYLSILFFCSLLAGSCTSNDRLLYGSWQYIGLESPHQNPPEVTPEAQVKEANASITFTKDGTFTILWADTVLSRGTFKVERDLIRITEQLPGNKTRSFPFIIKKLDETTLVFETARRDAVRVTAVRKAG